jgi:hypothetical protein
MSRRKREIRGTQTPGAVPAAGAAEADGETDLPIASSPSRRELREKRREETRPAPHPSSPPPRPAGPARVMSDALKENLLLGALVIYVLLLALGTAGELFEVDWILELPLFK